MSATLKKTLVSCWKKLECQQSRQSNMAIKPGRKLTEDSTIISRAVTYALWSMTGTSVRKVRFQTNCDLVRDLTKPTWSGQVSDFGETNSIGQVTVSLIWYWSETGLTGFWPIKPIHLSGQTIEHISNNNSIYFLLDQIWTLWQYLIKFFDVVPNVSHHLHSLNYCFWQHLSHGWSTEWAHMEHWLPLRQYHIVIHQWDSILLALYVHHFELIDILICNAVKILLVETGLEPVWTGLKPVVTGSNWFRSGSRKSCDLTNSTGRGFWKNGKNLTKPDLSNTNWDDPTWVLLNIYSHSIAAWFR